MALTPTLIGLALSLLIFAISAVLERRPPQLGRIRMVPHLAIMFASLLAGLLFFVHLVQLVKPPG